MKRNIILAALLLIFTAGSSLSGCKAVKEKLGITEEISSPSEGSPEFVVYEVVKAGILFRKGKKDEAWKLYKKHLHTDERSTASLKNWKENHFTSMVKKVHLYTVAADDKSSVKDSDPTYAISRREESDDGSRMKIFVVNEGNADSPTPCKLKKDGDKWGITHMCL
jgi:hypothetical protein